MNQTVKVPLIDTILRIVVLFLLIAWCIGIILPFLEPVIWGGVIAITLYPFFGTAKRWVGNRNTLAGVLLTLLILVMVPAIFHFSRQKSCFRLSCGRCLC